MGERITIETGGTEMPAYAVRPELTGVPGLVVLHEIFGLTPELRGIADLVASLGYAVVAPNLFHRTHPDLDAPYDAAGFALGREAAAATTLDDLRTDVHAAVRFLRTEFEAPRIATWGFCYGGSIAFLSATMEDVDAAVAFYAGQIAASRHPDRPPLLEFAGDVVAPLFFAFGGHDAHIPAGDVERIRATLTEQGKTFSLELYEDEDHAFFRHGPDGDVPAGAKDVWPKVREFLARHLGA